MSPVHPRWLPLGVAFLGEIALLLLLQDAAGLRPAAWAVAVGAQLVVVVLFGRGLVRHRSCGLGPANLVTLSRAVLTCAVAGLAVQSFREAIPSRTVVLLSGLALALDAVDGWVARRTRGATELGARFDMETDALLILALSGYVAGAVGWWVLLIGLARYLLLGAQRVWPSLRGPVAPRSARKVIAAIQGVVLVVAASGLLPRSVTIATLAGALALLVVSFAGEVRERVAAESSVAERRRFAVPWESVVSGLAVALVWIALVAPSGGELSPWLLVRIPVEGLVLVVVVVLLPDRWGGTFAVPFGLLAATLLVLKSLNAAFTAVLDRPFDPIEDWVYLSSAVGVLADSVGRPFALLVAALTGCLALALFVMVPLATKRVCRLARRHRGPAAGIVVGIPALALVVGMTGLDPQPGHTVLSSVSAALAVEEVRGVRAGLRDRAVFAEEIATDRFAATPGNRLLHRLRGKDALLVFVKSYGRAAVQGSSFAPGVEAVLGNGTRRLREAGYGSRSAYLTSPTFGAASWLAHSTLQSGVWVDSQRRYAQLLATDRLTLTGAFDRAGWRTVFDVPANTRAWPEGSDFYGFDSLYDAGNVGYRGPKFGYAAMPDQYTLFHFRTEELLPVHRPRVMAEIDLVSSHHPWAPLPRLVPWRDVGDGSVFAQMPEQGDSAEEVFSDSARVRQAYGRSIEYTLRALVSFLTTYRDDDLVVVMLGDHQPHHYVSGADSGHDVPVTVIARDPEVIAGISDWGWTSGLRPLPEAPVWRMDALRDRFLSAFSVDRSRTP